MPTFQVTVDPPALKAERGTEQPISVTVTNSLERPASARVTLRPGPNSPVSWVTPPVNNLARYPGRSATAQFTFTLKIPADAPPGTYALIFDVVDTDLGDDHFGTSPPLSFTLAPIGTTAQPPPPKRWWILVAAAVLVLGVGFLVWKLAFGPDKGGMPDLRNKPYAEAVLLLDSTRFSILRADTLSRDTSKYKPGTVIGQSIRPGARLSDGVNMLVLTVQQRFIRVPPVLGIHIKEAAELLGQEGLLIDLQLKTVKTADPRSIPDMNNIIQVSPPPGTLVRYGERVAVKLVAPLICNQETGRCVAADTLFQWLDSVVRRTNLDAMAARKP